MRYFFLFFILLLSCENENNIHEKNMNLLDEIITLHDELMVDMKELISLKGQLVETGISSEDKLVMDLDKARSSMMTFMKEFSEEFPFDKYPMDKDAFQELDKLTLSSVNEKLMEQKKSIDLVYELFEMSKLNANEAIKNL
ncbi:MAG: hypothetical protein CBE50_001040 [Flammeovirgaceae bacterium TMED290]|nr:MAG: hypothetical protein CBE50_001040 [Flammeovirgaceae bacterium TMED290]|tara:strand:- start:4204 stop:4626 length:423 start_codon:yes stop_codon:yes gene_type:complete